MPPGAEGEARCAARARQYQYSGSPARISAMPTAKSKSCSRAVLTMSQSEKTMNTSGVSG